nr:MAG TPA: hypothetical protein [Caudoviricetes sp.]
MAVFLCCMITRARIGLEIIYSTYGCRHMTTPVAFLVDMAGIGHNCAVSVFH